MPLSYWFFTNCEPPPGCVCGGIIQNWPGYDRALFTLTARFGGKHADVRTLHGLARRLRADGGRRRRREGTTERNERRRQIEFTEPFPPVVRLRHVQQQQQTTRVEVTVVVPPPRGEGAPSGTILLYSIYGGGGAAVKYYTRRRGYIPIFIYLSYIYIYYLPRAQSFKISNCYYCYKTVVGAAHLVNVRELITHT